MRRALLAVLAGCLAAVGAAAQPEEPPPAAPADGALRIRLVFGDAADLDVYVSDPLDETVYYGNTPARSGGALLADVRCDSPPPRVETVIFARPPAGRYRVSVDYPERCRAERDPLPYRVVVEWRDRRREQRGVIELGHFAVRVLEFDVPAQH